MTRRRDLDAIADLLGLPRDAVRGVERRKNGDYAVVLRTRPGSDVPYWAWSRRVFRISARRVHGYLPRTPFVHPRDRRARAKVNAERFACWLYWRLGRSSAPVVERALDGDLEPLAELRAAIIAAAPEPEPELIGIVFVFASNGRQAAA